MLLKVHGFDFVPESLRSSTFTEAAARVLAAHFAFNNFFNEQEPCQCLQDWGPRSRSLRSRKCLEATLAVYTGNAYGTAWAAVPYAKMVLDLLRPQQWEYFLNECLRRDRTLLDKLSRDEKPIERWVSVCTAYKSFMK